MHEIDVVARMSATARRSASELLPELEPKLAIWLDWSVEVRLCCTSVRWTPDVWIGAVVGVVIGVDPPPAAGVADPPPPPPHAANAKTATLASNRFIAQTIAHQRDTLVTRFPFRWLAWWMPAWTLSREGYAVIGSEGRPQGERGGEARE
jgi:hypothetical protein